MCSPVVGNLYIQRVTAINGATSYGIGDLHNAYVDLYAYHGIVGCILVGLLYIYLFYKLFKLFRFNKMIAFLIVIIFFVSILFGMAETYTLFISMSANTFSLSFIIIATIIFELKGESEK